MDPRDEARADILRAAATFVARHDERWQAREPMSLTIDVAARIARRCHLVPRETLVRAGFRPRKEAT